MIQRFSGQAQAVGVRQRTAKVVIPEGTAPGVAAGAGVDLCLALQLLAAFLLETLGVVRALAKAGLSTSLLAVIGLVGIWRGLKTLESIGPPDCGKLHCP